MNELCVPAHFGHLKKNRLKWGEEKEAEARVSFFHSREWKERVTKTKKKTAHLLFNVTNEAIE